MMYILKHSFFVSYCLFFVFVCGFVCVCVCVCQCVCGASVCVCGVCRGALGGGGGQAENEFDENHVFDQSEPKDERFWRFRAFESLCAVYKLLPCPVGVSCKRLGSLLLSL